MSALQALLVASTVWVGPTSAQSALQTAAAPEAASQTYLRFRTVALSAKSIDEVTAFWSAALMREFNMTPKADKPGTLDTVKRIESMITDVKVTKETATPAGATLSLEGTDPDKKPMTGTVDFVKENGSWKLSAQEQWQPKKRFSSAS